MNLSEKLIVLRKENGWSQEDFAEKLEVSRQAVSRWENGTALPDAQNILRISKLFRVSADYLLNDDFEEVPAADTAAEEARPLPRKKKRLWKILIPAVCLTALAVCVILEFVKPSSGPANHVHTHYDVIRVVENKVAPTCTEQGFYDEVFYCAECGEEVMRTHVSEGIPAHQFENQKCIVCGKDQWEKH